LKKVFSLHPILATRALNPYEFYALEPGRRAVLGSFIFIQCTHLWTWLKSYAGLSGVSFRPQHSQSSEKIWKHRCTNHLTITRWR